MFQLIHAESDWLGLPGKKYNRLEKEVEVDFHLEVGSYKTFAGKFNRSVYKVLRLPQKFIHPRFFIYSSKVCIIVQPIAILVQ